MTRFPRLTGLLAAAVLSFVVVDNVRAGEPTEQLRTQVEQVLKILQTKDKAAARGEIRTVANKIFDFQETAKRSLGPHWQQRTPAEREEFTKLFTDLLEQTYVSKIEQYNGEKVAYTGDEIQGDHAVVHTKIVTAKGTEVPVDYRMLKENAGWRVYDVAIEGVSLVSNYRSQFNKIIRTSSYGDLVAKMRAKEIGSGSGSGSPADEPKSPKDSKESKAKRPS
jgi:phospholipid transport system substrate-binding protein